MIHKLTSIFLSLLLIIGIFNFPVFATNENSSDSSTTSSSSSSEESKPEPPKGDFTVQVDTAKANAGDPVIVLLRIINNPGVMAMTISITYDSSALDYQYYYPGTEVFSDYTVKEHPSRNIIRLVISEETDKYNDGLIVGFRFNVAKDAEAKLHEMTVEYSSGDFCNNDLVRLMPKIVSGGVDVAYNGTNCGHRKCSDWTEIIAPTCTTEGAEQRTCAKCGHIELRNTDPAGHDYEDKWTVDIPATKDSAGTMSRHCKNCESTTDETNFTLQNSEDGNIQNEANGSVPDNDITSGIIVEQHPDLNKDETVSSEKPTSSDETASADKDNSEISSNSQDASQDINNESLKEQEKTEEQIKDIIEIIAPDKTDEEKAEITISINQKLREVFPKIDTITKVFRISFIMMIIFIIF